MSEPFTTSTGYMVFCDIDANDPYVKLLLKSVEDRIKRKLTKKELKECTESAIRGKKELFMHFWPKPVKFESELTDDERAEFDAWLERDSND